MEIIRPTKQNVWGWPGVVNFILGGMGTGLYLLSSLVVILQNVSLGVSQPAVFELVAPALACLGFIALPTGSAHVKGMILDPSQPLRSRHLFRRLNRSWMSRETLSVAVFVLAAVLDWLFPHPLLWILAMVAAISLMVSHGFILYRVRAVIAWSVALVPFIFLTSGFATGGGVMLLMMAVGSSTVGTDPLVIGLVCVVVDLFAWLFYLYPRGSRDVAFREATGALRRSSSLLFTVGIGRLLPALLLLSLLVVPDVDARAGLLRAVVALDGLAMIVGGIAQKAGIVLKAGYLRGIVMGRAKSEAHGSQSTFHPLLSHAHQGRQTE